jgi:hypothetical protein
MDWGAVEPGDTKQVHALVTHRKSDYRFSDVVLGVVTSDAFRMQARSEKKAQAGPASGRSVRGASCSDPQASVPARDAGLGVAVTPAAARRNDSCGHCAGPDGRCAEDACRLLLHPHGMIMDNTPTCNEVDAWTPSGAGADCSTAS